jgi:hypothetical protein
MFTFGVLHNDELQRLASAHRIEKHEALSIAWIAGEELRRKHGCVPERLLRRIVAARCRGAGAQLATFSPAEPPKEVGDLADPLAVLEAQEFFAGLDPRVIFQLDAREAALAAGRCARTARRWAAKARVREAAAQGTLFG